MGTTSVDEFLSHWGVKGMKWGVRNDKKDDKSSKSSPSGPGRSPAHALSDEQLQKHIARMELEQRYNNLAPKKKNSATAEFLKKHANQAAGAAISMATTVALQQAFKKVVK